MVPTWFSRYLASPSTDYTCTVAGAAIAYRRWSTPPADPSSSTRAKPGLVFVHGYGAHTHWWDFIAPAFQEDFNVIALDLSGAGDSEHRQQYSASQFAAEIMTVIDHAALISPIVVGHSFGGAMTRLAGYLHGTSLTGIVLVDSLLTKHRGSRTPPKMPRTKVRHYPTLIDGAKRFRLRPPQRCANKFILDHIAMTSLAHGRDGYYFKLDQALFSKMADEPEHDFPNSASMVSQTNCPVATIYGEKSRFFPEDVVALVNEVIEDDLQLSIPNAEHHVFLDQPQDFIESLGILLVRIASDRS